MVDRISGQGIQDTNLLNIGQQGAVDKTGSSKSKKDGLEDLIAGFDKASISDEALQAWEKEKEALRYTRQVQMTAPNVDYDKVARIKNLVDSSRINDYLNTVDTNALVDNLLSSPAGAFLR